MAKPPKVELSTVFDQVLAHPDVKAALLKAAATRLNRARYLAYKSGRTNFGDNLRVETGIRPGTSANHGMKRPFARITSTITPEEHAADNRTAKLSRTQILRRSA